MSSNTNDDIKRQLRKFITTEVKPGAEFGDSDDLLASGIIDSMAMTKLIDFLDRRLAIEVPDDDLEDPDNFESLDAIAALVLKHTK